MTGTHSHHHSHFHGPATLTSSRRRFLKTGLVAAAAPLACLVNGPLAAATASLNESLGQFGVARNDNPLRQALRKRAAEMMIFDTHEHLWHEETRLKKKVDFFLLMSHYTYEDLISAGMPPAEVEALQNVEIPLEARWRKFASYWPLTRTTGYGRCVLIAARDLFGIEDINERTVRDLSEKITEANRPGWYQDVLKNKAKIEWSVLDDLSVPDGGSLHPDLRFFKLVACFDYVVTTKTRGQLTLLEKATGASIHSLNDMNLAVQKAFDRAVAEGAVGIKSRLAYERKIRYEKIPPADAERAFEQIFASKSGVQPDAQSVFQLQNHLMHQIIRNASEHNLVAQLHTGFQSGQNNTIMDTNPALLNNLIMEYPRVRFDLFHGGYPYSSELATLAKNCPNVYADLCWLHIIAPGVAKRVLHEWIETIPANKILGFGGDFFHVEGAYGHAQMARAVTAEVLAEKVEEGYLKENEVEELMERILHRNGTILFTSAQFSPEGEGTPVA